MAGLNMRAKATLDINGFKAGARGLRAELNGLKSSFIGFTSALGAGLGLFSVISRMKDTAVSLNVARATLENVSDTTEEYAENLRYVDNLSKTYKQDIIVLTDSFSRFHAAALGTNFTLEQQKEMYKGLVQAATYFHMSSERTENMLIAVEQMMSKGKVTAEELRRQLGNNLPGAYAKMAQAAIKTGYAGVKSFADFEKAMKAGKIGVDLLAQFIQDLNEQTKNFNTDSMQLKINELKNAFTDFVESSNFEDWFSNVIDKSIEGLNWLKENIKAVSTALATIAGVIIGTKLIGAISNLVKWVISAGKTVIGILKKVEAAITFGLENFGNIIDKIGQLGKTIFSGGGGFIALIAATVGSTLKWKKAVNDVAKEYEKIAKFHKQLPDNNDEVALKQESKRLQEKLKELDDYFKKHPQSQYESWKAAGMTPQEQIVNGMSNKKSGVSVDPNAALKARQWEENDKLRWLIKDTLDKISLKILDITEKRNQEGTDLTPLGDNMLSDEENKFEKVLQKYIDKQKELHNQLENHSITLDKYNSEMNDLVEKSWQSITAFDNFRGEMAKLPASMQKAGADLEKYFGELGLTKSIETLTDAAKDYFATLVQEQALKSANLRTEQEYNHEMEKAGEKAVEAMYAIKNLEAVLMYLDPITRQIIQTIAAQYGYFKGQNAEAKAAPLTADIKKLLEAPDLAAKWAYKDTTPQFFNKMANEYESRVRQYEDIVEKVMKDMTLLGDMTLDELNQIGEDLKSKAQSYQDLADISEWAQDLQELKTTWRTSLTDNIVSSTNTMVGLVNASKQLKDTLDDTTKTDWEKFMAVWDHLVNIFQTLRNLQEMFMSLQKAQEAFTAAKNAKELRALSAQYFLNEELLAQKKKEIALDAAAAGQAAINTNASLAEQSALAGKAVAGATASGAKLAYPFNILAIATGVAAVIGALSNIKKYATGGIVGGNSRHGDKILAGLNSGEIVVNGNQQQRLWNILNGKTSVSGSQGGKVEFVISGSNLRGVLKNDERMRTGRS